MCIQIGKRAKIVPIHRQQNFIFTWKTSENLQKKQGNRIQGQYKIIVFLYTHNEQLEIEILKNPNRILKSKYLKWYCYFIEAESRFNTMNNIIATKKLFLLSENNLLNDCQCNGKVIRCSSYQHKAQLGQHLARFSCV